MTETRLRSADLLVFFSLFSLSFSLFSYFIDKRIKNNDAFLFCHLFSIWVVFFILFGFKIFFLGKRTETGKVIITNCFPVKYTEKCLTKALAENSDFDDVELLRLREAIAKKNTEIERVNDKKSEDLRGIEKEAAKYKAIAERSGLDLRDDSDNVTDKDREKAKQNLERLNEKKSAIEAEAKKQTDQKNAELNVLKEKISNEDFFDFMFRITIGTLSPEHQLVGWFSTSNDLYLFIYLL